METKIGPPQSVRLSEWLGRLLPCRANRGLRNKDMAGPLDTGIAKRPGGEEAASVRRSLSRLCLVAVRSMAFKG